MALISADPISHGGITVFNFPTFIGCLPDQCLVSGSFICELIGKAAFVLNLSQSLNKEKWGTRACVCRTPRWPAWIRAN